jgi:tRNA(Ile)-lysidine synthetase-like protein
MTDVTDFRNYRIGQSTELDMFKVLKPLGFTSKQIEAIANGKWKAEHRKISDSQEYGQLIAHSYSKGNDFKPSKEPFVATLDADKVVTPLVLRRIRQGDRFKPYGMKGCSKLISDFLTDKKIDMEERQKQCVVCDANGEIVWLPGHRISQDVACSDNTINILELRYSNI